MAQDKSFILPASLLASLRVWGRRAGYICGAFAALVVLSVGTGWLFLKSPFGEALVADAIINTLGRDGDVIVTIESVGGSLPESLTLYDIVVKDRDGPWLEVDQISVTWRPWAVFTGRITVEAVDATAMRLIRLPITGEDSSDSDEIDLDGVADLLARLRIETLNVTRIEVTDTVIGVPISLGVSGSLTPGQTERAELALTVVEVDRDAQLALSVALRDTETLRLSLQSSFGTADAQAQGTINVRTERISLSGQASTTAAVIPEDIGLKFDRASVDFSILGTVARPQANGNFIIARPEINGQKFQGFEGAAELGWDGRALAVQSSGGLVGVHTLAPDLTSVLRDEVLYSVSGGVEVSPSSGPPVVNVESAELESGNMTATLSGTVDLESMSGSGRAVVTAVGLGRIAGQEDESSQTSLEFNISTFSKAGFQSQVSGSSDTLEKLFEPLGSVLGGPVVIEGQLVGSPGVLAFENGEVTAANTLLLGNASFDTAAASLQADITGRVANLSPLAAGVRGAVELSGSVTGPLSGPQVSLSLTSEQIDVRRETLRAVTLNVDSNLDQFPLTGSVKGTAEVAEGAITFSIDFIQERDDLLRAADLMLSGEGISVQGAASVSLTSGLIDGAVEAIFESLALPSALAGVPLSGSARGRIEMTSEGGAQNALWTVDAGAIRFGGADAGLATLDGTGRWTGGEYPTLDLNLRGRNGFVGTQPVANAALTVSGPMSGLQVAIEADAPNAEPRLGLEGQVGVQGDTLTVIVEAMDLIDAWGAFSLDAPSKLTITPDRFATDKLVFDVAGGQLQVQADVDRQAGMVSASLNGEGFPFAVLETFDPDLPITGHFSFSSDLSGALSAPQGSAHIRTTNIALPDTGLDAVGLDARLALKESRLTIRSTATGLSDSPAVLEGSVPLRLDLVQGQARIPLDQPADLSLAWSGAIDPVWSLLPLISHRLSGDGDVSLTLSGSLGEPILEGYARLANGTYENLDLGTLLQDVRADVQADDRTSVQVSLAANDGEDGSLSGGGRLIRVGDDGFAGNLSLTLNGARLVRRDDVRVKGSGRLEYAITPERDSLTGDISVDSANISLNASYVEAVPTLNVVDPSAPKPATTNPRAGKETDLAIRLSAASNLDVVGRGLDSEWSADMTVGGTLAAPELTGSLDLLRGGFAFLGELFPLTKGQVLFTGGGEIDPELDILAERTSAGFTARVEVAGRASAPSITLGSDPVLPEDEVLSRLLFGRSAGQLGPLEAVQLANAAVELSGLTGRGGVVGTLRRSVGLDVFRFGSNASGNTLVVGERLSKNIFVGVEQGLEGQGSEIIIEWQLTDSLALSSAIDQDAGSDIGVQWSRDY